MYEKEFCFLFVISIAIKTFSAIPLPHVVRSTLPLYLLPIRGMEN